MTEITKKIPNNNLHKSHQLLQNTRRKFNLGNLRIRVFSYSKTSYKLSIFHLFLEKSPTFLGGFTAKKFTKFHVQSMSENTIYPPNKRRKKWVTHQNSSNLTFIGIHTSLPNDNATFIVENGAQNQPHQLQQPSNSGNLADQTITKSSVSDSAKAGITPIVSDSETIILDSDLEEDKENLPVIHPASSLKVVNLTNKNKNRRTFGQGSQWAKNIQNNANFISIQNTPPKSTSKNSDPKLQQNSTIAQTPHVASWQNEISEINLDSTAVKRHTPTKRKMEIGTTFTVSEQDSDCTIVEPDLNFTPPGSKCPIYYPKSSSPKRDDNRRKKFPSGSRKLRQKILANNQLSLPDSDQAIQNLIQQEDRPGSALSIKTSASNEKLISCPEKRRQHHRRYTFFMPTSGTNVQVKNCQKIEPEDYYRIDPYNEEQSRNAYSFIEKEVKNYLNMALSPKMWDVKLPGKKTLNNLLELDRKFLVLVGF